MKGIEKTIFAGILTVICICACKELAQYSGVDYVDSLLAFLLFQFLKHEGDHPKGDGKR